MTQTKGGAWRRLRHEAGPLQLDTLSRGEDGQQAAVAMLLQQLSETLLETDHTRKNEQHIGRFRKTRLQFWSGEPGVGKTSAYLSIRDWFNDPRRPSATDPKLAKPDLKLEPHLAEQLNAIFDNASRVRWLEPLDLEPLSGRPNFLASVAVRIDKALGSDLIEDREITGNHEMWLGSGASGFRKAFSRFSKAQE